jgi:hypothetical protein
MSSNMSFRRRRPPELPEDPLDRPPLRPPELEPDELEELVEYFVDVLEVCWVFTSVPKSAHSEQTSSSAPSTFTVFGSDVSAPHISH